MIASGVVLFALATLIAFGNLVGVCQAIHRKRKGIPYGFSTVPLFSLLFSIGSLAFLYDTVGYWALIPTAIDPATWSFIFMPFFIFWSVSHLVWSMIRRS
jgi:hypothetical protein